jgi:hypothetical protein
MAGRKEQMQRVWHQYDSRRDHKPSSVRQAAAWAVADGFLTLPEVDPIDILAEQMAQAVREEYKTDSQGRPAIQLVLDYRDDVAEREQLMLGHFRRRVA